MDRRELILARLFAILTTLAGSNGIKTICRNRGLLPEELRPAITLLDGDESMQSPQIVDGRGGRGLSAQPGKLVMRPEIFVVLDTRLPKNEGIGEDLNAWRIRILKAMSADTEINTLLTTNGSLLYEGCLTDLATGRSMEGQLQMQFALSYPLKESEFAAA